ncbi:substrate-binding domain-containing protein [Nakamurella sp. YIM 132087]|uniref:Substrate-binding domain-containing protein n=1 Tax=Nakamurella alba TaxID=2665158 RepID=A0A7K1FRD9_9ACTN|nr:sugar ABC transporter substrate-binding protein [Nakamurella alba]MTD16696.1 substrate-binding domain-containing protein [Nakamurella alba]
MTARLTRRGFLTTGAMLGAGLLAGPVLAGCSTPDTAGGSGTGSSGSGAGTGTPTTDFPSKLWTPTDTVGALPDRPKRIAWQNIVVGVTALEAVESWVKKGAEEIGYEYLGSNSNGNSAQTITQMNQAITRGIMGMVAPGQELPAQVAAMKTGMAAGSAMFLFNTGGITCGMAAVQYQFGRRIGEYTATYVKEQLGGTGKVVFINLNVQQDLRPRETGFMDAITEAGLDKSIVTSVDSPAAATQEEGYTLMNTYLQKAGEVDVVAAAGDDLALGAMSALKAAGMWESKPKLMVCGIDGNTQAIAAIKAANTPYKATSAVHYPMVGYAPARLIGRWGEGKTIPQFLEYQSFLIDSADAATKWETDQDRCPELYEEMLGGDTTYIAPRGEISYATRGAIYEGDLPVKLPDLVQ